MVIPNSSPESEMLHPMHEHPLQLVNPMIIYPSYNGHWKCDNCSRESSVTQPFHCAQCSFDLCQECISGYRTPAHQHPLFYVETSHRFYPEQNGVWQCDICQKTSTDLQQIHSFHCSLCNFDMCHSCMEEKQHPIHVHPLRLANMSLVYPLAAGQWECDCCGTKGRCNERFAYHCTLNGGCDFDCCGNCFKEHQSPLHAHPLIRADSHLIYSRFNGGWRCDNCGSIHSNVNDNKPWHCQQCEFDLCNSCMTGERQDRGFDETGPRLMNFESYFSQSAALNPWNQRQFVPPEPMQASTSDRGMAVTNPESEQTTDSDESNECIICLVGPKSATLIHGDTGHCCCCWPCAQVLKKRQDPCPICRAPIDHVIKQYKA